MFREIDKQRYTESISEPDHEYRFLFCIDGAALKDKAVPDYVFTEKVETAPDLWNAIDYVIDTLKGQLKRTGVRELNELSRDWLDDVLDSVGIDSEKLNDGTEEEQDTLQRELDKKIEDDSINYSTVDYFMNRSEVDEPMVCFLGIMEDGKILGECIDEYMEGFQPDYRVYCWQYISRKCKNRNLDLKKWGKDVEKELKSAIREAQRLGYDLTDFIL